MNPRIHSRYAIFIVALIGLVFSCKKDNSNANNSNQSVVQTQADDQTMVSNESEMMTNDANTALSSQASINGESISSLISGNTVVNSISGHTQTLGGNVVLICDAAIAVDTTSNPRTITITYNGTNCWGNRTRTGTVVISIASGIHWKDQGAAVSIAVQNLKITRIRDGKTIIINGTKTITNVSGGSLTDLANDISITHNISDNFSVTFSDNEVRSWQTSKQRVFTYNNGIVFSTTGTHSDGTNTNVAEWGTNRYGTTFESLISVPKVFRQDCDFRLVSGQNVILRSDSLNSTITYGLDATGSPTSCPGSGNYYLEIVWTFPNGKTLPIILPY